MGGRDVLSFVFAFLSLLQITLLCLVNCQFILRFNGLPGKARHYLLFILWQHLANAPDYYYTYISAYDRPGMPVVSTILPFLFIFLFSRFALRLDLVASAIAGLLVPISSTAMGGLLLPLLRQPIYSFGLAAASGYAVGLLHTFLCWFFFKCLLRKSRPRPGVGGPSLLAALFPLFLVLLLTQLFMDQGGYYIFEFPPQREYSLLENLMPPLLSVLVCLCVLCSLFALHRLSDYMELDRQKTRLEQQFSMQASYAREAALRYRLTRSFRHDLNNHTLVIRGLLEKGKIKEASDYLGHFERAGDCLAFPVGTGAAAVDVLLSDKLALARQADVAVCCDVSIPEGMGVSEYDLCVIFANGVDNALRACTAMGAQRRWLDIKARRNNGFFLIDMVNSRGEGPAGKPGVGLENIRAIAEKYGGAMRADAGAGLYTLTVLLALGAADERE